MKKKLFLALLTTLLLLVAASAALADSPSNYICTNCDVPCTSWVPVNSGGLGYHMPSCDLCGNLWQENLDLLRCTHLEGSATCTTPAVCSVCGNVDYIGSEPDPNAHDISDSYYTSAETHYRHCLNGCYTKFDERPHTGGTATCADYPICTVCDAAYGNPDPNNHDWGSWSSPGNGTHSRTCTNNPRHTETANCSGGTATCTEQAVCEDCGESYGEVDPNAHTWDSWEWLSDSMHVRVCLACYSPEEAPHSGGDGSCMPTCEDCKYQYYDETSTKHNTMSSWIYWDSTQHYSYCMGCGEMYVVYDSHYGGDGSCKPVCEGCGVQYRDVNGQHSNMSDWAPFTEDQHFRSCNDCASTESMEFSEHSGGTATCTDKAVCTVCSLPYGETDFNNHINMSDWAHYSATQHYSYCMDCDRSSSYEYEDHSGGDGSCMPTCAGCGEQYEDLNGQHRNMCDWLPDDAEQHRRWCLDCNSYESNEYEDHYGGDGSCMPTCGKCGEDYINQNGQHGATTEWSYVTETLHGRKCEDCGTPEYAAHSGGTATCTDKAVCTDCGQPYGELNSEHTGGTATCTDKAVCTDCGQPYGELDPDVHDWGSWEWFSVDVHKRVCLACYAAEEEAPHSGRDGSCSPKCADCGDFYIDAEGQHRNMTDWFPYSDTQHYRYCNDCAYESTKEYGEHTGGTATCSSYAECEECGSDYGELAADAHTWGEWKSNGDGTHTRTCANDANHTENEACTGGVATCTDKAVCTVCAAPYGDVLGHDYGEWVSKGNGTHTRTCANDPSHTETEDCTGGKAACTEDGVCEVCDAAYIPAIQHSWGEWKSNGDGTHTRICTNDATHTETEDCTGGVATCTDKAICEVCGSEHGAVLGHIPGTEADCINDQVCTREGCGELLTEKLGHDYTAVVTKPTCTERGYTTYTCSRCEDSYKAGQTEARGHWFDLWYPNEDGTHSAKCKRSGCGHEGTTECTLYEITVKEGETETILKVCPVCGDHERTTFGVMSGTTIKNVYINHPLPHGEQIVRELDAHVGGVLYAFTAAYESSGRVAPFNGKVSVSLPLDAEKYAGFKLVRVDVTPETETTERTEVWTDVAFTFENGKLIFETDVAGLFLLVPME